MHKVWHHWFSTGVAHLILVLHWHGSPHTGSPLAWLTSYWFSTGMAHLTLVLHWHGSPHTGSPLAWLTSYLSSRTQCVCVGYASSAVSDGHIGVPQAAVLDPICFLLYISPIATVCWRHTVTYWLFCEWWSISYVYSWVLSSFCAFLVLSQLSSSKPQQVGGNNIWHSPTPQLFS